MRFPAMDGANWIQLARGPHRGFVAGVHLVERHELGLLTHLLVEQKQLVANRVVLLSVAAQVDQIWKKANFETRALKG
jgi:hypothetical protein